MRKSFAIIFSINMVVRIFLQGLLPIYPIIAEKLGASKQNNGLLLSASYSMLFLGTWLSGKLIPKIINAKLLFLISLLPLCIALLLLGLANHLLTLLVFSFALFFFTGLNTTSGTILIGYYSTQSNVGKNYGIIGLSNLLGSLLGGFIVGPVLYELGYRIGFALFASSLAVVGILAFRVNKPTQLASNDSLSTFVFSKRFFWLLLSSLLVIMLIHVFIFSFSLLLKQEGYSIKDISLLSAFGAVLALPLPYLLGKWTLKYKPKLLLIGVYLVMLLAIMLLLLPKSIPILILSVACMVVFAHGERPVIVALIFPWFNEDDFPLAQAYVGMSAWLAAIIGYSLTGFLLQHYGFQFVAGASALITLLAIFILLFAVPNGLNKS